tara:strand:- start:48 stop:203 length:156 start_codon:yes stop_codon:yes gene_type:complete
MMMMIWWRCLDESNECRFLVYPREKKRQKKKTHFFKVFFFRVSLFLGFMDV